MVDAPLAPSAEEPAAVPHPLLGYALVVGAVVLWSANAVVAKVVLGSGELSALRLSEVRGAGAGLIMFVALLLPRPASLRLAPGEWLPLALFGICGLAVVQFLYFAAIERLDIGTALVIE